MIVGPRNRRDNCFDLTTLFRRPRRSRLNLGPWNEGRSMDRIEMRPRPKLRDPEPASDSCTGTTPTREYLAHMPSLIAHLIAILPTTSGRQPKLASSTPIERKPPFIPTRDHSPEPTTESHGCANGANETFGSYARSGDESTCVDPTFVRNQRRADKRVCSCPWVPHTYLASTNSLSFHSG